MMSMSSDRPEILASRRMERAVGGRSRVMSRVRYRITGNASLVRDVRTSLPSCPSLSTIPVFWIDDLRVEMILPNHRSILALDALGGDAGPDDFRQPVDIERIEPEARLEVLAHGFRPGLGAEDADSQ